MLLMSVLELQEQWDTWPQSMPYWDSLQGRLMYTVLECSYLK
uniref:Kinase family protein n=1 Tax=Rhizophora mucronata TaxID=61149 RepID=A0A2P2JJN2_RHIMU